MTNLSNPQVAATRDEAVQNGIPFYLASHPCRHGHTAPKRVSNHACTDCERSIDHRRKMRLRAERVAAMPPPTDPERVISRKDARSAGKKRYFTGQPCLRGHVAERLVSDKTCVTCDALRHAEGATGERARARSRTYYRAHRAVILAQAKVYAATNRKTISAKRQAFRVANRDRLNAAYRVWAKANRPILRTHERNREARERGALGTYTAADIARILAAQKGRCASPACRTSLAAGYHVDHITPLARGGTNWPRNLQLLCAPCNQSKHAQDPVEWAKGLGLLV